jgi:hypothetical protein
MGPPGANVGTILLVLLAMTAVLHGAAYAGRDSTELGQPAVGEDSEEALQAAEAVDGAGGQGRHPSPPPPPDAPPAPHFSTDFYDGEWDAVEHDVEPLPVHWMGALLRCVPQRCLALWTMCRLSRPRISHMPRCRQPGR